MPQTKATIALTFLRYLSQTMVEISSTLPHNFILGDRYKIVRQIGQGGFGRTYLAKDTHRYNEKCV